MTVLAFLGFPLFCQEVLRGEVRIDLEQVRGFAAGENPPLQTGEARRMALEDAARYYGGMIYGWSFRYEPGEKARNIEETLELDPLGLVFPGDPRLEPGEFRVENFILSLWIDYRPSPEQQLRLAKWKAGTARSAQAYGQSPLEDRDAALKDAARAALRSMLKGGERNRPKEVRGRISLAAFPQYWLYKGRWAAAGRFRVEILEIIPFAAY